MSTALPRRSTRTVIQPEKPVVVELSTTQLNPVHSSGGEHDRTASLSADTLRGAQLFRIYRVIVRVLMVVTSLTVLIGQSFGRDVVPPALALAGVALAEVVCSFAASRAVARFAGLGSILGVGGDPPPWRLR